MSNPKTAIVFEKRDNTTVDIYVVRETSPDDLYDLDEPTDIAYCAAVTAINEFMRGKPDKIVSYHFHNVIHWTRRTLPPINEQV